MNVKNTKKLNCYTATKWSGFAIGVFIGLLPVYTHHVEGGERGELFRRDCPQTQASIQRGRGHRGAGYQRIADAATGQIRWISHGTHRQTLPGIYQGAGTLGGRAGPEGLVSTLRGMLSTGVIQEDGADEPKGSQT